MVAPVAGDRTDPAGFCSTDGMCDALCYSGSARSGFGPVLMRADRSRSLFQNGVAFTNSLVTSSIFFPEGII